jgi:hypothetical protein
LGTSCGGEARSVVSLGERRASQRRAAGEEATQTPRDRAAATHPRATDEPEVLKGQFHALPARGRREGFLVDDLASILLGAHRHLPYARRRCGAHRQHLAVDEEAFGLRQVERFGEKSHALPTKAAALGAQTAFEQGTAVCCGNEPRRGDAAHNDVVDTLPSVQRGARAGTVEVVERHEVGVCVGGVHGHELCRARRGHART